MRYRRGRCGEYWKRRRRNQTGVALARQALDRRAAFPQFEPRAAAGVFQQGITDDLTTDLSKVSGLFVIARNSAFVYQNRPVTPKQVAEELGVRYVLEGSVQRAGDQLRINVQLVDALSGGHEWAERFDGSLTDVFALQDKVTGSIADALAVRLTESDQIALNLHETSIPAAYDAFLRGWVHLRRDTPDDYVAPFRTSRRRRSWIPITGAPTRRSRWRIS